MAADGPISLASSAAIVLLALLVRHATSLHPYSGHATPPMFGDYEAHRHWMEICANLPLAQWYAPSAHNDLQYWGIDYPPLSAYLSWALGRLAARAHPPLVTLHASRGHESAETKRFMRGTVLAVDTLVYFPAALLLARARAAGARTPARVRAFALAGLLLQPALVLVDHGHFQYNCVSLGLALGAQALAAHPRAAAERLRPLLRTLLPAAVLFCLSLNFKQMSLYYAPAFFAHMLGLSLRLPGSRRRAAAIGALGLTVLATFAACWLPFALAGSEASLAVLRRIFPVQRHIYEDKVANIWCTMSVLPFLKLRARASPADALRLSLGATAASLVVPVASMVRRPSRAAFELGLLCSALSFFLLSFQVHEKHILLALAPASALLPDAPLLVGWLLLVGTFSMFPLLERDGLGLAYGAHVALLAVLVAVARRARESDGAAAAPTARPSERGFADEPRTAPAACARLERALRAAARAAPTLCACSIAGMGALHLAAQLVRPPARYPDLYALLFCMFACTHFCAAWLALQAWHACNLLGREPRLWDEGLALSGSPPADAKSAARRPAAKED